MIPETGTQFRRLRLALPKKVTQERVAQWFGVTSQTVARWEKGHARLDRSAAILMWLLYDEQVNKNKNAVRDLMRGCDVRCQ